MWEPSTIWGVAGGKVLWDEAKAWASAALGKAGTPRAEPSLPPPVAQLDNMTTTASGATARAATGVIVASAFIGSPIARHPPRHATFSRAASCVRCAVASFSVPAPTTLVAFLSATLPDMKKSTIKDRLRDGGVIVNGAPQHKATYQLQPGDVVELSRDKAQSAKQGGPVVDVLHVDRDLAVVVKPSGLLTVGTGKGKAGEKTVLNVVGEQLQKRGDRVGDRFFPCHRLDRGTSGVLLLPRSPEVQHFFFEHWAQTQKTYVAVVESHVTDDAGTIDAALFEDPNTLTVRVSTQPNARPALTHYRVLKRGIDRTLVELQIETGRKHQIRVHMLHLGHAVVGDDRYSKSTRRVRLCLHARSLRFPHPATGEDLTFHAAVPPLFDELVR